MKTHPATYEIVPTAVLHVSDDHVPGTSHHRTLARLTFADVKTPVRAVHAICVDGRWYELVKDEAHADKLSSALQHPLRAAPAGQRIDDDLFDNARPVELPSFTAQATCDLDPAFIKVKEFLGETIPCDPAGGAAVQAAMERAKEDVPAVKDTEHALTVVQEANEALVRLLMLFIAGKLPTRASTTNIPPVPEIPAELSREDAYRSWGVRDPVQAAIDRAKEDVKMRRHVERIQSAYPAPTDTPKKAENQCNCGHCLYCLFHFFGLTPHSSTIADIIRSVKDVVSPAPTALSSASDLRDIVSRIKAKNVGLRLLGFGAPFDTEDEMRRILHAYPTLLAFVKRVDCILTGTTQPAGCTCGACWHCLMAKVEADKAKPAASPPVLDSTITDEQWQCLMSLDAVMQLAPLEISEDRHAPAVSFVRRAGRLSVVLSRGYLQWLQSIDSKPSGIA